MKNPASIFRLCSIAAVMAASIALLGCEQETVSHSRYVCEDGAIINASFVDGKYVNVEVNGRTMTVPRVESASGTKYESVETGTVFWSKGMDINFIELKGAPLQKCARG